MLFTGTVLDAVTGQPLVKATISLDGTAMAATDSNGSFNFETGSSNYNEMEISFVGYQTATLPADQSFNETGQIQLQPVSQNLPPVTVTAKKPATNYTPYVLGGIGLLALAGTGKKKRVGKMDPMYLVLGGVALVGIYLLTKKTTAPAPVYSPVYSPVQTQATNPVAQDISAAAPVLTSVTNLIEAI